MTTGFTFAFDTTTQGVITFAAIDVVNTAEYVYASRLIVSTSTGGIMQFLQEKNMWSREESLSEVVDVKAVDLPELSTDRRVMYRMGEENWQERIVRQLGDITVLVSFIAILLSNPINCFIGIPILPIPLFPAILNGSLRVCFCSTTSPIFSRLVVARYVWIQESDCRSHKER